MGLLKPISARPKSSSPPFRGKYGDALLISAIMLCCFFVRRGVFPQLINNYKLFYVAAYWQTDIDGWAAVGENLISGKGYRNKWGETTAERGPLFPLYLALIFGLVGISQGISLAISMQAVLDALSCWLIWKLAWRLFRCRYTAALAAFMWALYLPGMIVDIWLYSEPLFTLILCLFNLSLLYLVDSPRWPRFLLAGILLGLATLCRPITLYFPLFLLPLLIWLLRRQFSRMCRYSLVFLFGFSLILSPWALRNYLQFKKFVPASTLLGYNWYYSLIRMEKPNYLELGEFYDWNEIHQLSRQRFSSQGIDLNGKNEAERDHLLRQQAWKMIKKYPFRYLLICLNRLSVIWFNLDIRGYSRLRSLAIFAIHAPIIILSILAFIFFRERWRLTSSPIVLLILYNSLAYALVLGSWRFSIPMMPYMFIFGAYAVVKIGSHIWPRISGRLT